MKYKMTPYNTFIAKSRYSRFLDEVGRREHWDETVKRYVDNVIAPKVDEKTAQKIYDAIYNLEVMPSMRSMMTAGEALNRDNVAGYNCSYVPINHIRS